MTRRFFGLQSALLGVLLFGSCKQDSITTVGIGTAARVSLEFNARTVAVADSVRTFARVLDKVGNPLAITVTLTTGCTAGIVSVAPASDAPLVRTAFVVKAVGFGSGCVIASASGFVDTLQVTTVPAALVVTGVTGVTAPDTANSGSVVTYSYAYHDAAGNVMTGLPASTTPSLSSADETIAEPAASGTSVSARAPGIVTLTLSGTGGVKTTKTLAVLAVPFTGTTSGPVMPGQFLTIQRDPAGPVFDTINMTVSIGTVRKSTFTPDAFQVRISDLARAGTKSFSLTAVGPNDVAYTGGSYTVSAPAAFAGTFAPTPISPTQRVKVTRNPADPAFDSTTNLYFRGRTDSTLAAVTPISDTATKTTITPDSFKLTTADLDAGGTYLVQTTRLGTNLLAWRGSYTLAVGTWGGTLTPSAGGPMDKIILRKSAGDPQFTDTTRVYVGGARAIVESHSTDTAVVISPWFSSTAAKDMRISRMAGTLAVDGSKVFTPTSTAVLDVYDHTDDTPDKPVPITANGSYYRMMSGACAANADGVGQASSGSDDCDDYVTITNTSATLTDTVTVNANWFTAGDIDFYRCDASALSNPAPNNVPSCGTFAGFDDLLSTAGAVGGSGTPEKATFVMAPGKTYLLWFNMFDAHGVTATVYQIKVGGLK